MRERISVFALVPLLAAGIAAADAPRVFLHTLYGLGQRWATDCGYANEHQREGRGQTVGHSCVLIDGQGQALSGAGLGTNGAIARFTSLPRYGYALADCTEAYNRNSRGTPGAVVQYARRHAFFVYPRYGAPAYALVIDDVRKDGRTHEFTWQMMFADGLAAAVSDDRAMFQPRQATGKGQTGAARPSPRLVVRIHADAKPVLSTDVFHPNDYHPPAAFPRLRATAQAVNPRFIALLLPLPAGVAEPEVRFESNAGKRVATILWQGHIDTFVWAPADGPSADVHDPQLLPPLTRGAIP